MNKGLIVLRCSKLSSTATRELQGGEWDWGRNEAGEGGKLGRKGTDGFDGAEVPQLRASCSMQGLTAKV